MNKIDITYELDAKDVPLCPLCDQSIEFAEFAVGVHKKGGYCLICGFCYNNLTDDE